MTVTELQTQITAADAYEDFFVPALFQQWAGHVADAARLQPGDQVLDVACGTGVLAREAASRVSPGGSVSGLDLNPGMLAVAARRLPEIAWRQGRAEALPYPDASFDAVVCQFGLMFFDDSHRALKEMLRVLAPGGRVAVAVWGSLESTPGYAAEIALVRQIAGERAAQALEVPFALGEVSQLIELFEGAGVDAGAVLIQPGLARFPSVRSMVEADLRGWLPLVGVNIPEQQIERILEAAEQRLRDYVEPNGKVAFDLPANIASGTKQQPAS